MSRLQANKANIACPFCLTVWHTQQEAILCTKICGELMLYQENMNGLMLYQEDTNGSA